MAERYRSNDAGRETAAYLDDEATPTQQGRGGGNLETRVGTRDMKKRAEQDRPGTTRVRKSDEKGNGGRGGLHGTGKES